MLAVTVPGDPGGTLIFTRMVSQGNSCEFGHYDFGYSLVRSPRIRSRAVHPSFNSQEDEGKFAQSHGTLNNQHHDGNLESAVRIRADDNALLLKDNMAKTTKGFI